MSHQMTEEEIYQRARKRVEEKKGFFSHLAVYVVVNAVLVLIWAFTSRGYPWFVWPLGGWGIGLVFHFLGVFLFSKETNWERNEIEKEAERIRKSSQAPKH
jgi:phosphate/sulfate permease